MEATELAHPTVKVFHIIPPAASSCSKAQHSQHLQGRVEQQGHGCADGYG